MSMVESEIGAVAPDETNLFPQRVGERLRTARVAAGLDLNDVAARTRVPTRHLEAIEQSNYANLRSSTYAIGFVRSYARAVGADEAAMVMAIRAELGRSPAGEVESLPYELVDRARVPSRLLAWTAAIIGLIGLIGYGLWRSHTLGGDVPDSVIVGVPAPVAKSGSARSAAPAATPSLPPASPSLPPASLGQVVLTATSPVWLRVYDKADKKLLEKEMAVGESYRVPTDADTPMVRTGRPDAIRVTVNGREVSPLGPPERTIIDVGVSAAALAARPPIAVDTGRNQVSGTLGGTSVVPARTPPRL